MEEPADRRDHLPHPRCRYEKDRHDGAIFHAPAKTGETLTSSPSGRGMICVSRTPATITGAAVSPIGLTPPSYQMHAATAIVTSKLNRPQVPDAPSQSGDQTAAAASNPTATVSVVVGRGGPGEQRVRSQVHHLSLVKSGMRAAILFSEVTPGNSGPDAFLHNYGSRSTGHRVARNQNRCIAGGSCKERSHRSPQ